MNHSFDIAIAAEYGVNAAIMLEYLRFWITKNAANGVHYHEGRYWTYNSIKALETMFPYMSGKQIRSTLAKLEEDGLIISGNYNGKTFDRTRWYTLTEKGECIFPDGQMHLTAEANPFAPEGKSICPTGQTNTSYIPFTNTVTDTVIGDSACAPAPAKRRRTGERKPAAKYGQYGNVKLTDEELAQLKARYPTQCQERIDRLSEYIASRGDKYKSHYATILSWARRDEQEGRAGKPMAQAPAKVNPAQQYVQRQYDNDVMKKRLAFDLSDLGMEG